MYLTEQLEQKWSPVLDHNGLSSIKDPYRRAVTAVVLENQEREMAKENAILNESDRKSTRLNSSHIPLSRMPSSA